MQHEKGTLISEVPGCVQRREKDHRSNDTVPGGMVIRAVRIVYSCGLKKQNNPIASQGLECR